MDEIGHHDDAYLSTPLEQKLAWFQNAQGLSAIEPARQFMSGTAELYTDSDAQVRKTMRGLGVDWTGDAAANAGATLQQAAEWSQGAATSHTQGGRTVEGYGQSFESLRGQVHWDDPWAWGWGDSVTAAASVATLNPAPFLANLTTDYFTTAEQNRTNDATAVAALRAHENQTRTAVDTFPSIAPAGIDPSTSTGSAPGRHTPVGPLPGGTIAPAPITPAQAVGIGAGTAGLGGAIGSHAGRGAGAGPVGQASGAGPVGGPGSVGDGAATDPAGVGRPGAGTPGLPVGPIGGAGTPVTNATAAAGGRGVGGRPAGGALDAGEGGAQALGGFEAGGAGTGGVGAGGVGAGGVGAGGVGAGGAGGAGAPGTGPLSRSGPGGVRPVAVGDPGLGFGDGARGPFGANPRGPFDVGPGAGPRGGLVGGVPTTEPLLRRATGPGPEGGWRDLASRPPSETALISRGPAVGAQFADRLPTGAAAASAGSPGPVAEGMGTPFLGGMGAGGGGRSNEHRNEYWVRSSEPFDVPLPPHGDGVIQGGDA